MRKAPSPSPSDRLLGRIALAMSLVLLQGCTHLKIEDCGGKVRGKNEARIRSSHFRMFLADLPAAADRFAPYAAMSALAYAKDEGCGSKEQKLTNDERDKLESYLQSAGWQEDKSVQWVPPCEDDVGMFFRVWKREADIREVVIAFRGTWGFKDWRYGNLHWFTRFLPMQDQYSAARHAAQRVFDQFPEEPQKQTRFYATGHSLGGGSAQHVLYSYPSKVLQAVAFNPSSATGFADQTSLNQMLGCECNSPSWAVNLRIYRVYDAYEISRI